MNLKEIINLINDLDGFNSSEPKEWELGFLECKHQILDVLNKSTDSHKVSIPKFVADWILKCKNYATLVECLNGEYVVFGSEHADKEFISWVNDNDNDVVTAKAWIFGYEVEEDKLYKVIIDHKYLVQIFSGRTDARLVEFEELTTWSESAYKLTEATIKSIDERYWAFAVPVKADES
ncbi:DUF1642 domain-containing protein [Enterococcus innesii]|uniref:DUF1642 domain-containing protein n=1 Tax=Enterococcus innesii TaxID=2839759 RepID=UPI0022B9BDF9|nr:DUF1642 domain-containing protein [Enterococcus innesii]